MTSFPEEVRALLDWLLKLGPWLIMAMTFAETAFVTGLLVPAGVALAAATFLAHQGYMDLQVVVLAAGAGALLGDQAGYWTGRRGQGRLARRRGRLGALVRRTDRRTRRLFQRHPAYAVTMARGVSFVRTLMPPTAGMSGIAWPRFLAFDVAGIAIWLLLYVSLGLLAGESWALATRAVGGGALLLFALVGLILYLLGRRGAAAPSRREEENPAGRNGAGTGAAESAAVTAEPPELARHDAPNR